MTEIGDPRPIKTVAVGTDGSPTASRAVDFAIGLAEDCGAEIIVASSFKPLSEGHLIDERKDAPGDLLWRINPTEEVEAILRDVEERARGRGLEVTSVGRTGDPAAVLCEVAQEYDADVLVVGSKGMHRRHLPSVPNAVSHSAPCSVLIVKTV